MDAIFAQFCCGLIDTENWDKQGLNSDVVLRDFMTESVKELGGN